MLVEKDASNPEEVVEDDVIKSRTEMDCLGKEGEVFLVEFVVVEERR
jgi:hypothetical protein